MYKIWDLMQYGSLPLLQILKEDTMGIGPRIFTKRTLTLSEAWPWPWPGPEPEPGPGPISTTTGGGDDEKDDDDHNSTNLFGLSSFVSGAQAAGVSVMLDVVANHMGNLPGKFDFSGLVPFNTSASFHDCNKLCDSNCNIASSDWNPPQAEPIEHCRLSGLPDLNQDAPSVRSTLLNWIKHVVSTYKVDGLRIDTVPEVKPAFWAEFQNAASVYAVGEVFNGDPEYVGAFQGPLDATLSYPMFFTLRSVFGPSRSSMNELMNTVNEYKQYFKDPSVLGTFVDNHDNPRFLSLSGADLNSYKNALVWVLFAEGIPIIYYGTEQQFDGGADPDCREDLWRSGYSQTSELFKHITTTVAARKNAAIFDLPQVQRWSGDSFYAFTRGDAALVCLTNVGTNGQTITRQVTYLPSSWTAGTKLQNVYNPNDVVTVASTSTNGVQISITLQNGSPKIYVPVQQQDEERLPIHAPQDAATFESQLYPQSAVRLSKGATLRVLNVSSLPNSSSAMLVAASIQGLRARQSPDLFLLPSGYSAAHVYWQNVLEKKFGFEFVPSQGLSAEATLAGAKGYALCDMKKPSSVQAAVDFAAASEDVIVCTENEVSLLEAAGLAQAIDARALSPADVWSTHASKFSNAILVRQDASKTSDGFLVGYAVFSRAFTVGSDLDQSPGDSALHALTPGKSCLLGWGSEGDLVKTASKAGVGVNAADWALNLAVYSNLDVEDRTFAAREVSPRIDDTLVSSSSSSSSLSQGAAAHHIAFVTTDGDNIQWMVNDFTTAAKWWGDAKRGAVPVTWTVSPALSGLAPMILSTLREEATVNDTLISGPSGWSYTYPSDWTSSSASDSFLQVQQDLMEASHLAPFVVVLDDSTQSSAPKNAVQGLADLSSTRAVLYWEFYNYSGLKGNVTWAGANNSTPVIGGRANLWQGQNSPEQIAALVNSLPKDPSQADSYSIIPVHVWSMSYESILQTVSLLDADVRVVGVPELVQVLVQNVRK